jgi:phospholipase D1/2
MVKKYISQLVSDNGKAVAPATSAPGCFIHDKVALGKHPNMSWGTSFAEPCSGNKVRFFVTGEEYFVAVAAAIAKAKKTVYIAGWQVNFDVELVKGWSLYRCLEAAMETNPGLHIYVMPWLSPKVGVDTGDFETMLAIFQLNAGSQSKQRAFAVPAIAQSDMLGGLGIGFSHHQKLVVVDEQTAFVGGIDLAYGRRDDGRFLLAADGRVGNELYNSCVPPVHELSRVEQTRFLTRAELFAACFTGNTSDVATFITSAPAKPIAAVLDGMRSINDSVKQRQKAVSDWWTAVDLVPEFVRRAQDIPVDIAQESSRFAYHELDRISRGRLEQLRKTGAAQAANAATALLAWLNNASMEQLPAELRHGSVKLIEAFVIVILGHLSQSASRREARYANLHELAKILPASGKVISASQPRMPWHDIHSSVSGPAVRDLSRNFMRRWNGIAQRYESSYTRVASVSQLDVVFNMLGLQPTPGISIPRLYMENKINDQPKAGKCWVQVLRSAPCTMQLDEASGNRRSEKMDNSKKHEQNNCLKAMLTAIQGAQKFLYIEGQFFQSAYGVDLPRDAGLSGPMAALMNLRSSPEYEKHARRLGIFGIPVEDIPSRLRASQVDDVMRDINGKGPEFLSDLDIALKSIAAIKASNLMGKSQREIGNPIGEAIGRRIEDAIFDGLPFHVYMVLPVHPEGTLNTLNIMTQLHITMQSLVFGSDSLVNRIGRAILAEELRSSKKMNRNDAVATVAKYDATIVAKNVKERWRDYLTLLNLRNWQILAKRPVTEQIYVHSKLLIADDRVAILGSANINDRSQLGNRDSELAIIVRDDEQISVRLDGINVEPVSLNVHDLRVRLWKKLFGLMGSSVPADCLMDVLTKPAAKQTWEAIQRVAQSNALRYKQAFPYLANVQGSASSIWPTWDNKGRCLAYFMPFSERFWREADAFDKQCSWDAKSCVQESVPIGIQGYIVALPISWTKGENNMSGMNLSMLA